MKKLTLREKVQFKTLCKTLGIDSDIMIAQLVRNTLAMNQQLEVESDMDEYNEEPINNVYDTIGSIVITQLNGTLYENNKPISLSRYYDLVQGHQLAEEARMLIENDEYERKLSIISRRKERSQVQSEELIEDVEWKTDVVLEDTEKYDGKWLCYGAVESEGSLLKETWFTVSKYKNYQEEMIIGLATMNQVGYVIGKHLEQTFVAMQGEGTMWNGQEIIEVELDTMDDVPAVLNGRVMTVSIKDDKVLWCKFKEEKMGVVLDLHEQEDEKQIQECMADDTHKLHVAQQSMSVNEHKLVPMNHE